MTMDRMRYPIGPFEHLTHVSRETLEGWIDDLARLPAILRETVRRLEEARLLDAPYRPGGWTARQVVHHLADSHLNSYARVRWALTEEIPTIKPYDEARWAELPDARNLGVEPSLLLLEGLHLRWVHLLRMLREEQWDARLVHPQSGPIDLRNQIGFYAWHGRHHTAHLQGLLNAGL